ncbi:MAG: DUF5696 domain-containing protein [Verrucomicrobiae bacterium]|nr:DUF5696 domain-containing protein [Verrucomicrobiae bacterium]
MMQKDASKAGKNIPSRSGKGSMRRLTIANDRLRVRLDSVEGLIEMALKGNPTVWRGAAWGTLQCWSRTLHSEILTPLSTAAGWSIAPERKNNELRVVCMHRLLELSMELHLTVKGDVLTVFVPSAGIVDNGRTVIRAFDLLPQFGGAEEGSEGYIVVPQQTGVICRYKDKISAKHRIGVYDGFCQCVMPIMGIVKSGQAILGNITRGQFDASLLLQTAWGPEKTYSIHPSFTFRAFLGDRRGVGDICVEYHFLSGMEASYVGMAKRYRTYNEANRKIFPLRKKALHSPAVDYSCRSICVRMRLGVKPVPSPVPEQTPATEPAMQVLCSFKKVREIMDEFHRQGFACVEFCLVGWNCRGHDGRYPQIFPVEDRLGGKKGLRKLIEHGRALGFKVAAHDCYFDAYRISKDWREGYLRKSADGYPMKGDVWGGGKSYHICPKCAFEKFAKRDVPKMRRLGFCGLHYTDVLSCVGLQRCYDDAHPLTRKGDADARRDILRFIRAVFGGVQSEAALDFAAPELDRILYIQGVGMEKEDYVDEVIPLYPLVYHGYLLYNVTIDSINSLPGESAYLKNIEFGGMPAFYFYKQFVKTPSAIFNKHRDLRCDCRRDIKKCVAQIKPVNDDFAQLAYLQKERIENHRQLDVDVYETIYGGGSRVIVNYGRSSWTNGKGLAVKPRTYRLIKC